MSSISLLKDTIDDFRYSYIVASFNKDIDDIRYSYIVVSFNKDIDDI
jgi:hypothetical protein